MYNRTRRLRKTEGIRRLVQETKLSIDDFVYPLFIEEGNGIATEIPSMPGINRFSLDKINEELDDENKKLILMIEDLSSSGNEFEKDKIQHE